MPSAHASSRLVLSGLAAISLAASTCHDPVPQGSARVPSVELTPPPAPTVVATATAGPTSDAVTKPAPDLTFTRDPELWTWLSTNVVYPYNAVHSLLYVWVTRDELAALRRGAPLLSAPPGRRDDAFAEALSQLAGEGDRVAAKLRSSSFDARRRAWSAPWATRLSPARNGAADQLVAVKLRENAYVVRVELGDAPPVSVTKLDHGVVEAAERSAECFATAFHVHRDGERTFREYLLLDEAMIAQIEYGTPDLKARLQEDAKMLGRLRALVREAPGFGFDRHSADVHADLLASRRDKTGVREPADNLYRGALALQTDDYLLTPDRLAHLELALRASLDMDAPFTRRPSPDVPRRSPPRCRAEPRGRSDW